jgi:hypothetical protein
VHGPYGLFISLFEPVYPVFVLCVSYHLGVFVAKLAVLFVDGVVEIVPLHELVYFSCDLADLRAFLFEGG